MFNCFISGCFRAVGAGLRQQVEPQEMLPPPPPGLGGEQEGRTGGGSVPRQVIGLDPSRYCALIGWRHGFTTP